MESYPPGMRVTVYSGDGDTLLGNGTYVGDVAVYVWVDDEVLKSEKIAEHPPHPKNLPRGVEVRTIARNPKIQLDDGTIVYGCQVWWRPVEGENG